jgi:hypothetical protein
MTTDLGRMILAARQIGEVVEEDLVGPVTTEGRLWLGIDGDDNTWALDEQNTLDLLTARVWRAVQEKIYGAVWGSFGIMTHATASRCFPDLPSAVAAIHGWWRSQQPVEDKH